jgi:FkbM family methyltransferase
MVWPKSDTAIGRALGLYGEFAEAENRLMARFVATGDMIIDVGANLGTTVLPLARATGPTGQVIAFEPQPLMAQCLCATLTLNELFNVRLITAALSNRSGWGHIPAPVIAAGGNYGAMALGAEGMHVPVLRLDDLELPSCALIKIDVEGFEWPVIQGAMHHLIALRPVIYLEAKRIPGTVAYLDWLMKNGWHCYWHFAFFFRPDNFRGNAHNVFGGTGDMNVLAVPTDRQQPKDLPEIKSSDEDWTSVYEEFYANLKRSIP